MEEEEFSFYKIIRSEKTVVLPCLKKYFETKLDLKYPYTPWTGNAESVELFRSKEEEFFKNSLRELSKSARGRKRDKRNRILNTYHDDQWVNYHWDISKFKYALVDSKMFKLDETDDTGIPVSERIVKLKEIRNDTAHSTKAACEREHCDKILTEISDHIKGMKEPGFDTSTYIEDLERIKSEEKPISCKERCEMRLQYEKLRYENQIYKEREKTFEEKEKNTQLLQELNEVKGQYIDALQKINLAEMENNKKFEMLELQVEKVITANNLLTVEVNKLKYEKKVFGRDIYYQLNPEMKTTSEDKFVLE
ncbi:uncharacterized protein LOC132747184 [Ruditapes philippinarum]|uniref:uncharacterized protein LOC132747184 n=1 Tax=Ruditapes philippinarum TaxID=129788 RepID=UPI00295A82AA|nr:uncharacterized protein LOC132747184 [Ruditapes philippinarum]XP_060592497.1 uncharacterized protein LOC132747184 [Ruditapes philippinarum]